MAGRQQADRHGLAFEAPDGAAIKAEADRAAPFDVGQQRPLEATGGELPYIWLVNGSVLAASPFRRQAEWQPDGRGEARITVIDRAGRSASAEIWIE